MVSELLTRQRSASQTSPPSEEKLHWREGVRCAETLKIVSSFVKIAAVRERGPDITGLEMDRSLSSHSMDNVLESMIFKATQFPRTDSEDQFRKFLERIPSTTNLANHQGSMQSLPQSQQEQLQQQMAQFQQQSLQLASSGAPLSTQLPEGGSLNVGGIPRVPSLDLLRQLVTQQQQQTSSAPSSRAIPSTSAAVKEETEIAETSMPVAESISKPVPLRPGSEALRSSAEPALSSMGNGLGLSLPVSLSNLAQPLPMQSQMNPAIAAAAALQLDNLSSLQSTKADSVPVTKDSKADVRRARRMRSNRESARRSRRRKQEHLSLLEEQILGLEEERDQLQGRVEKLEKQVTACADQNHSLKRENEDLRQQLGIEARDKRGNARLCNGHLET